MDDEDDEILGTEGEGTEGSDPAGGDEGSEVSAQHADGEEDDGKSPDQVAAKDDGDDDGEPARPQSRAGNRFQRLSNENRELKARLERQEQERENDRRDRWLRENARNEQEERERRALMSPEERYEYDRARDRQARDAERQQDRLALGNMMDRNAFDAKAAVNPVYAKFKDEVEARHAALWAKGQPVDREVILKFILGERALNGAATNRKAAAKGKARVDAQRVPSGSGKGDAASQRGKAGDTPEKRLQGVFI